MRIHSPVEKLLTAWVIGVIVSLVAAAGALFATNKLVYGPEGKVREYFHALQTGNGSYALGLLGPRIPTGPRYARRRHAAACSLNPQRCAD